LPNNLVPPPDPESIRDAKEWMASRMAGGGTSTETLGQPALTALFDLDQATRHFDSFDKCLREITSLIVRLRPTDPSRT
jgi:hypothetical protein